MKLIDNDAIKLEVDNKTSLYKFGFIDGVAFAEEYLKYDIFDFAKWCYLNNVHFIKDEVEYSINGIIKILTINEIIEEYLKTKNL